MIPHDVAECRPAMLDPVTGRALADDDPIMVAVYKLWETLTVEDKLAWHEFCCLNSRKRDVMVRVEAISVRLESEVGAAVGN